MPNGGGSDKGFSQLPDIENQESAVVELVNRDGSDVGLNSCGQDLGCGGVVPLTVVVCDDGGTPVGDEAVVKGSVDSSEEACLKSPKKKHLPRIDSFGECRICQQEKEEILIELGCQCRGGLAKAHRSCIDAWFRTKGSNKCEICQEVAANVPPPLSHLGANYWVWRIDPTFRGSVISQERERGCFSPLWVAFSILIGGLLLDVLISVTLGVSALPVNIIIGVIVVLGLGTALRLALDFCHEWSLRRAAQRIEVNENPGYHSAL